MEVGNCDITVGRFRVQITRPHGIINVTGPDKAKCEAAKTTIQKLIDKGTFLDHIDTLDKVCDFTTSKKPKTKTLQQLPELNHAVKWLKEHEDLIPALEEALTEHGYETYAACQQRKNRATDAQINLLHELGVNNINPKNLTKEKACELLDIAIREKDEKTSLTQRQLDYIKILGGNPRKAKTKADAGDMIDQLLEEANERELREYENMQDGDDDEW